MNIEEKAEKVYDIIEDLDNKIEYEERKCEVCGYGKSDLMYIDILYATKQELEDNLEILENGEDVIIEIPEIIDGGAWKKKVEKILGGN